MFGGGGGEGFGGFLVRGWGWLDELFEGGLTGEKKAITFEGVGILNTTNWLKNTALGERLEG